MEWETLNRIYFNNCFSFSVSYCSSWFKINIQAVLFSNQFHIYTCTIHNTGRNYMDKRYYKFCSSLLFYSNSHIFIFVRISFGSLLFKPLLNTVVFEKEPRWIFLLPMPAYVPILKTNIHFLRKVLCPALLIAHNKTVTAIRNNWTNR